MTKQETLKRVEEGMKRNDCLVAKEVMDNMEKLGISPSIAINGQVRKLCLICDIESRLIDESEKENFVTNLKNNGYQESDFWFAEYNQIQYRSGDFSALSGKIIVISKKSGNQKEYNTGYGISWLVEFTTDLQSGFYKE